MKRGMRAIVVLSLCSFVPLHAEAQQPPPLEIRDAGCPMPWCDSCQWKSDGPIVVMDVPRGHRRIIDKLEKGEISSLGGKLYTTPIKATVQFDHPPMKKGDVFYLLDRYLNEDKARVWFQGKIFETEFFQSPAMEACQTPSKDCWWHLEEKYVFPELWLKVKARTGFVGWVSESSNSLACMGNDAD